MNLLSVDAPSDKSDSDSDDDDDDDDNAAPPPPPPPAARRPGSGALSLIEWRRLSSWFQRTRTAADSGEVDGGSNSHAKNKHTGGGEPLVRDDDWVTPLYAAARCGNVRIVQLLLRKGADVRWANRHGATPLWAAATVTAGHLERTEHGDNVSLRLVRALLAAGADPNQADRERVGPLYLAAQEGNAAVVRPAFRRPVRHHTPR